jgi:hypothetical protein
MNSTEFSGKAAFITGAGSGIGAATAVLLAEQGAAVALLGRRKDKLDDVAARIRQAGGRVLAVPGDVGVPSDVERAIENTVAEFGALHYGVNNASMSGYFEAVADLSIEQWNEVINVNLSGLFYSMKYEVPPILAAGGGAIVNVSSVFADRGGPTADYSSAKHAGRDGCAAAPARLERPGPGPPGGRAGRGAGRGMEGGDLARHKRTAADLGAWLVFEDESGQGLYCRSAEAVPLQYRVGGLDDLLPLGAVRCAVLPLSERALHRRPCPPQRCRGLADHRDPVMTFHLLDGDPRNGSAGSPSRPRLTTKERTRCVNAPTFSSAAC